MDTLPIGISTCFYFSLWGSFIHCYCKSSSPWGGEESPQSQVSCFLSTWVAFSTLSNDKNRKWFCLALHPTKMTAFLHNHLDGEMRHFTGLDLGHVARRRDLLHNKEYARPTPYNPQQWCWKSFGWHEKRCNNTPKITVVNDYPHWGALYM